MWLKILQESSLYLALRNFDREIADEYRLAGCACSGKLHSARYERKPRGCPVDLPREYVLRESFDYSGLDVPAPVETTGNDSEVEITWGAVSGATSYNLYWDTSSGVTPGTGN